MNTKIALVKAMNEKTRMLNKKYNSLVDTTEAVREKLDSKMAATYSHNIKVYTTKHWMLAKYIVKQLRIVISNKKKEEDENGIPASQGRTSQRLLKPIIEAESRHEVTQPMRNSVAADGFLPQIGVRGSIQGIQGPVAEINQAEERAAAVNDSEVSVDENEFSEVVMDTAFHNDKKNLK